VEFQLKQDTQFLESTGQLAFLTLTHIFQINTLRTGDADLRF